MSGKLFTGIALALLVAACSVSRNAPKTESNLDGSWTLSVFLPDKKKTLAEVFGTRVIEMRFDTKTQGVAGTTGCNRFSGSYKADTVNLLFSKNQALTKMACPGYNEQAFLNALNRVNRYRLMEGELELRENDSIVMIFAKKLQ